MSFPKVRPVVPAVLLVAALGIPAANSANAQVTYVGRELYPLSGGGYIGSVASIAPNGQTAGYDENDFAHLWSPPNGAAVNLHPAGFDWSRALGNSGSVQVGHGGHTASGQERAILWNGTAASAIELHPSGYTWSQAIATDGTHHVGSGAVGGGSTALLWTGTSASPLVLNPPGVDYAYLTSLAGGHQGGAGSGPATGEKGHAFLWSGTPGSAIDLHPVGFVHSQVSGVGGIQQVGFGTLTPSGDYRALLWTGSAASAVNLHPDGFNDSLAAGTNGVNQVGNGSGPATGGAVHALLWSGTAASAVDLHLLLPSGFGFQSSNAISIDPQGNIFGVAAGSDAWHVVQWTPVPEPSSLLLLTAGISGLAIRGRFRNRRPAAGRAA
jgi:hypothetical protein